MRTSPPPNRSIGLSSMRSSSAEDGFTFAEMLAVIVALGLLTVVVLPAFARPSEPSRQIVCRNNLRQLGAAFFMYAADFQDAFPAPAAKATFGPQPEDWVWWQLVFIGGRPSIRDVSKSAIVPYLPDFNDSHLRCPEDQDSLRRLEEWRKTGTERFFYSYSLNAFNQGGMASWFANNRSQIQLNRHHSIVNPAQKIMLAEERGGVKDGPPVGGGAYVDDGRWVPPGNTLTIRHDGRANVAFADGRVELVTREFAQQREHYDPQR